MRNLHRIPRRLSLHSSFVAGAPYRRFAILILLLFASLTFHARVLSALATAPTITGFKPASAIVGASVTITGTGFSDTAAVVFNGVKTEFKIASATQITALVPKSSTSGPISVITKEGTATSAAAFVVILPPAIASFDPISAPVGATVTIKGSRFTGASAVSFNSVSAAIKAVSDTQITAIVPQTATSGPVSVTAPGGTASSATPFTVVPPPAITGFTPTGGLPGVTVTITGANFSGATAVNFNGVGTTFQVVSATQITAKAPATGGPISVTNAAGTATSASRFSLCCLPVVTFVPTTAIAGAEIPIMGADLQYVTAIAFNNVPCQSFRIDSPVLIRAILPAGVTGSAPVTLSNPLGSVSSAFINVVPPAQ